MLGKPQAEAAGDDDAAEPALRQREIARDRAEAEAEAVERGGGEAVVAGERGGPQRLVVAGADGAALDRGERLVEVGEAGPGDDALDRDAAVAARAAGRAIASSIASSGAKSMWPPSVARRGSRRRSRMQRATPRPVPGPRT